MTLEMTCNACGYAWWVELAGEGEVVGICPRCGGRDVRVTSYDLTALGCG